MTRSRIHKYERCKAVFEATGQRCSNKDGHYPATWHLNEMSGHEVRWDENGNAKRD